MSDVRPASGCRLLSIINWSSSVIVVTDGPLCIAIAMSNLRPDRSALSTFERALALCLSLVWLCGGALGLYAAVAHNRWLLGFAAIAALVYGAAWVRVVVLSRLITWSELVLPWRRL